jgi:hypothetical protein
MESEILPPAQAAIPAPKKPAAAIVEDDEDEDEDDDLPVSGKKSEPPMARKFGLSAEEFRSTVVRNAQTEVANVIRSADDLARDYKVPRGPWHQKVISGGNRMLEGIMELRALEIKEGRDGQA